MPPWLQLLLSLVWIATGLFLGRRSGRTGTGLIWAVVFGPVGVLLFGYGEWRRSAPSPEPVAWFTDGEVRRSPGAADQR